MFPRLLLAAVDDELGDPVAERVEGGPKALLRRHLGELAVIADEHDLGAGGRGLVDDGGKVAGACHAGFVDDDHGRGGDGRPSVRCRAIVVEAMPAPLSSSRAARATVRDR